MYKYVDGWNKTNWVLFGTYINNTISTAVHKKKISVLLAVKAFQYLFPGGPGASRF